MFLKIIEDTYFEFLERIDDLGVGVIDFLEDFRKWDKMLIGDNFLDKEWLSYRLEVIYLNSYYLSEFFKVLR